MQIFTDTIAGRYLGNRFMFFVATVATYGKATFAPRMCFVTIFHFVDYALSSAKSALSDFSLYRF